MKVEIQERQVKPKRFPGLYKSTRKEDTSIYIVDYIVDIVPIDGFVVYGLHSGCMGQDGSWKTEEELNKDFERLPAGTQVVITQEV